MGDQGLGRRRPATHRPAPGNQPPAGNVIEIQNRQRRHPVSRPAIGQLVEATLLRLGRTGEIGVHLVGPAEMARVNWGFLRHEGSTDVLTFDHGSTERHLHGECFICVADAEAQASEWKTTWSDELGRYLIHALLHLAGYDDLEPTARRVMKRRENALTQALVTRARWVAREAALEAVSGNGPRPRHAATRARGGG